MFHVFESTMCHNTFFGFYSRSGGGKTNPCLGSDRVRAAAGGGIGFSFALRREPERA